MNEDDKPGQLGQIIDLGSGCTIETRARVGDGVLAWAFWGHTRPDGMPCGSHGYIAVSTDSSLCNGGGTWRIDQSEPLTLSPSLLCMRCNRHGWIRDGKWVPA